jgi:ankyrin repeat protein
VLLARKAAVDARTRSGNTPLHAAARHGDAAVVAMLLKAGASVRATNDKGRQPLHEAGSVAVAVTLLKQGADPNAKAIDKTTPLHAAASEGKLELAESLLARGAKVDAANDDGETPLHAAIRTFSSSVTYGFGDQTKTVKRVDLAPNATRMVSLLLERKANANAADRNGATPLHRAARANDIDLVRLLLSRKANANARDRDGRTPLAVAVAQGNKRVADLLLRFTTKK